MKKIVMITIFVLNTFTNLFGQYWEKCGKQYVEEPPYNPVEAIPASSHIQVKIVFHIVRKDDGSFNVTDEQIELQLQKLNSVYSPKNITFVLFQVNRVNNTSWATLAAQNDSVLNEMLQTLAVDTDRRMNVYSIATPDSSWIGLSSYPWEFQSGDWRDGIIIDYGTFPNGYRHPYNLGATLVHEAGHYLGIKHTFSGPFECKDGDQIDDTPIHKTNYVCNDTDSCPNQAGEDPIHNYMNYTDDYCTIELTAGQFTRIREKVAAYRPILANQYYFVLDQTYTGGQRITGSNVYRYQGNGFTALPVTNVPARFLIEGSSSDEIFKPDVSVFNNQKFKTWLPYDIIESVFGENFQDGQYYLNSRFHQRYNNIVIRNRADEGQVSGLIGFADPWYIYYPDSRYHNELNNLGLDATPLLKTSPINFNLNQFSDYKGVFLNQGGVPPNLTPPYYKVKAISPQTINIGGSDRKFYFRNWSAEPAASAAFQNGLSLETPVVFKNENAVVSANYKGSLLSNNSNAFSNNGQRKVVKTANGYLHVVYESMDRVWYERSTDNGATWDEPKMICYDFWFSKQINPAIDCYNNYVYILLEDCDQTNNFKRLCVIEISDTGIYEHILGEYTYSFNATAVLSVNKKTIAVIRRTPSYNGLTLSLGTKLYRADWEWNDYSIPNTDNQSYSPAISQYKIPTDWLPGDNAPSLSPIVDMVWVHQNSAVSSQVYYQKIITSISSSEITVNFDNLQSLSLGCGYSINQFPSITSVHLDTQNPWNMDTVTSWVGWIGKRENPDPTVAGGQSGQAQISRVVLKSNKDLQGKFRTFSDEVQSVNINSCNNRWTLAWGRSNNSQIQYFDSRNSSNIYQMGLSGKDVQISNGINPSDMYGFVFNSQTLPYTISSKQLYPSQNPAITPTVAGQEGVVTPENGGSAYYSLENVLVNGQNYGFASDPEYGVVNNYLMTEPIYVTDETGLSYTVRFGVTDSTQLQAALSSTDSLNFRVELIDANTFEVLGVHDVVTYNSSNLSQYDNASYLVNTQGVGPRYIRLRLVVTSNFDQHFAVSDKLMDDSVTVLCKKNYRHINYKGDPLTKETVKEYTYSMEQNYPNPFNPVTRIAYSIKEPSFVTITIYDILGNEVQKIVNEQKQPGSHIAEFNGTKLASGTYIYELKAGTFREVKKMILMK